MITSPAASSARVSEDPIEPHLYDFYTTNADDPSVVRFAANGDIVAATPSRLIAHITSPSFVDYDLLGHFFLTFRSFLSVTDLLTYLVARLQWAVNRADDFGRIVRVRTFVALRHWILNYFVDDYLPDYTFRLHFCTLINKLCEELRSREDGGAGDLKIVNELKRCWRRTCAEHWEAPMTGQDAAELPIVPGGGPPSVGSGEIAEQALVKAPIKKPIKRRTKPETLKTTHEETKSADWSRDQRQLPHQSVTSGNFSSQRDSHGVPLSPASELSMQVLSCSIPMRLPNRAEHGHEVPLYPHPVPAQAVVNSHQPTTSIKPWRQSHGHKRSGSFSDALRDSRGPLPHRKNSIKEAHVLAAANLPGSLVRGAVFQPGSPYIDVKNPAHFLSRSLLEVKLADTNGMWPDSRALQSPGVKRLLGSVRRALSSKHPNGPPSIVMGAIAPPSAPSTFRSSNPATVDTAASTRPINHKKKPSREQAQVRIDVLAARVGESFRAAIIAELEVERQGRKSLLATNIGNIETYARQSSIQDGDLNGDSYHLNSPVTVGSRSIVIMDDTRMSIAPPMPVMSGALPMDPAAAVSTVAAVAAAAPEHPSATVMNFSRPLTSTSATFTKQRSTYQPQTQHSRLGSAAESNAGRKMASYAHGTSGPVSQSSGIRKERSPHLSRRHSSTFRRQDSTRSVSAGSLRRYASFNSTVLNKPPAAFTSRPGPDSRAYTASSDNDPFVLERVPVNKLRRRPGGDLRAVDNVHDLAIPPRPKSAGTLSTRTLSFASSHPVASAEVAPLKFAPREHQRPASIAEEAPTRRLSLMDTHSSQPNLRPSFEAEVAKLAALPDDEDDGGVESALLKLEGKYEKKSPSEPRGISSPVSDMSGSISAIEVLDAVSVSSQTRSSGPTETTAHINKAELSIDERPHSTTQSYDRPGQATRRVDEAQSAAPSVTSYNSIPLLQRGLSDATPTWRKSNQHAPIATDVDLVAPQRIRSPTSPGSSIEYIEETESMRRIPIGGTIPTSTPSHGSFTPGDDQHLGRHAFRGVRRESDNASEGVRSFFSDEPANLEPESTGNAFFHPLRHPPTPPLTAETLLYQIPPPGSSEFQKGLPTPGLSPITKGVEQMASLSSMQPAKKANDAVPAPIVSTTVRKESPEGSRSHSSSQLAHLPFIMAYDSQTLAEQLTVIEKDALDEIDWKELIELRWKQSSPHVTDWVEYLRTQEPEGVDVVIARFNLVVKWAVSEILLTESIEERAKTIIKYIHVAAHTRRLRNYATTYQITIALLSSAISRLTKTWEAVPSAEKATLKSLEDLVQPTRNFHNLRVEMETSSVEEGCIPFIGIYTRDLIYNGQKPEVIGSAPTASGEWLVNFERCLVAASIVKSLLRLLEASSNYKFQPNEAMISKCLWIAALSDDEINALGKKLD